MINRRNNYLGKTSGSNDGKVSRAGDCTECLGKRASIGKVRGVTFFRGKLIVVWFDKMTFVFFGHVQDDPFSGIVRTHLLIISLCCAHK
jgi:hypothetical protein